MDRDQKAKIKIDNLINWFDTVEIPQTLQIGTHCKFNDLPFALKQLITDLRNATLYGRLFLALFRRLEEIKKQLEDDNSSINSK